MSDGLTQDRVRELLHYVPETGVFTWKVSPAYSVPKGSPVRGRTATISGRHIGRLRLAWLYCYGELPTLDVVAVNGDRMDSRISNLTLAKRERGLPGSKPPRAVTQALVREMFHYCEVTGNLTRRTSSVWRSAGERSGGIRPDGYRGVAVGRKNFLEHRIIWLYVHGEFPPHEVDHVDGNRSNNRISNLRLASRFENMQNLRSKRGRGGLTGVVTHVRRSRTWYGAKINANGVRTNLGLFNTPTEAHEAYCRAKAALHTFQPTLRGSIN